MIQHSRFASIIASFLLAASPFLPIALSAETPNITVVAFGDFTTALRSTVKQVYAQRLPALLAKRNINAKVINSGVGGSHTGRLIDNARHKRQHALDRFQKTVRDHKPQVVVIQFGYNDSWVDSGDPDGPSRIPLENYRANLTYIVKTLKSDGSRVILMTPNRPKKMLAE